MNDFWTYEVDRNVWKNHILPTQNAPDKTISCQAAVINNGVHLVFSGCIDLSRSPSTIISVLNMHAMQWETPFSNFSTPNENTEHSMLGLGDNSLIMFGGDSYGKLNNNMLRIFRNKQPQIVPLRVSLFIPWHRADACMVHYGDEAVLFVRII